MTDTEQAGGRAKGSSRAGTRDNMRTGYTGKGKTEPPHAHGRVHPHRQNGGCPRATAAARLVFRDDRSCRTICQEVNLAGFGRAPERVNWPSRDCQCRQVRVVHKKTCLAVPYIDSNLSSLHRKKIYAPRTPLTSRSSHQIYRTPQHNKRATMRRVRKLNGISLPRTPLAYAPRTPLLARRPSRHLHPLGQVLRKRHRTKDWHNRRYLERLQQDSCP